MEKIYEINVNIDMVLGNIHKEVLCPITIEAENSAKALDAVICQCGLREDDEYNYELFKNHLIKCGFEEKNKEHYIYSIDISAAKEIIAH